MKFKNNNGVTMISLVITIIVLIILATITIYSATGLIKRANIENLKTNMLLIEAKAKTALEETIFKIKPFGDNPTDEQLIQIGKIEEETLIGIKVGENENIKTKLISIGVPEENIENCYYFNKEELDRIGLDTKIAEQEYYVVQYDFDKLAIEVYYTKGYDYKGVTYYSLTQLEDIKD